MSRFEVVVEFIIGQPPEGEPGHAKIHEFGWHGQLGLSEENEEVYREAVTIRDMIDLKVAGEYLLLHGWSITEAETGLRGE